MEPKSIYKSKIFWVGVVTVLGGIVEFIFGLPAGASAATIIAGVVNIILRAVTNQPVTMK